MKRRHFEVLSAFFDGEHVPPRDLVAAFRDPAASEFLAFIAQLRLWIQQDRSRPSRLWCRRMRRELARADAIRAARSSQCRALKMAVNATGRTQDVAGDSTSQPRPPTDDIRAAAAADGFNLPAAVSQESRPQSATSRTMTKPIAGGDDDDALLTAHDVARRYGVDCETVRRWVRKGILPVVRVGPTQRIRFHHGDIERYFTEEPGAKVR
jgi:excisionase family DNA binding protein